MRRRAGVGLLVAVGLVALGAVTFSLSPMGANALAGERSAGFFSWSSPLVASRSSRTMSVQVDVEGRDEDIGCDPEVLPRVRETRAAVTVRVEIIDRPLPMGTACGGAALSRLPVKVALHAPIGDRAVVDGQDAKEHTVLVVDRQPTIRNVPHPFVRRAASWDESGARVGQWWRWQAHGEAAQIDLDVGPGRSLSQLGLPATATGHASVRGVPARVWRQRDADIIDTTVLWTTSRGRTFHLQVLDQSARPLSLHEVVELARSVE